MNGMKKLMRWHLSTDGMRKVLLFLIGGLVAALLCCEQSFAYPIRVLDGDTFEMNGERYRLYGVDCPEKKQPYGQEARQATSRHLYSVKPRISLVGKDHYGRNLAIVHIGDATLQELLLAEGAAWLYTDYCRTIECVKWGYIHLKARAKGLGIWSYDDPVPPWEWRKERKNR